jgi:Flp pilus assembly protein TadG
MNSRSMLNGKPRAAEGKRLRERGSAIVEFALILPLFLALILGGMDLFLCEMAKSNLSYIATQAANCGVTGCSVQSYVNTAAPGLSLNPKDITVKQSVPSKGEYTVTLDTQYKPIGPVFPSVALTASATSVLP